MPRRAGHPTTFLPLAAGFADLQGHHRHLLDDRVRTKAFVRAIAAVVRPGQAVADLGAGTGILSFAARAAGARVVYAIERGPILGVAQSVAAANSLDRIVFVEGDASRVTLPEPVDVIVSECFGPLAVGGTMIETLTALRARTLRPDGRVLPERVTLIAAPLEAPRLHRWVTAWSTPRYGLDWSSAARLAVNNLYNTVVPRSSLIAAPQALSTIDLQRDAYRGHLDGTIVVTATRTALVHGFAAWFEAQLAEGLVLSTAPGRPETIWRQVYLPLAQPIRAPRGAPITLHLVVQPAPRPGPIVFFDWRGTVGEVQFAQSTRYSFPETID